MMPKRFPIVALIALCSLMQVAAAPPTTPNAPPRPAAPAPAAPSAGAASGGAPSNATGVAGSAVVSGGETLPSVEQLNAMLAEGKHADVLKHVAKLIQLKGDAAKAYDRYELLCLRGEAALRGKSNTMAMDAFAPAARATEDKDKQAVARATELLIRRSKPLGYMPRTAGAPAPQTRPVIAKADPAPKGQANQPIPIIEPADRKRALAALFADEFAVVDPKVQAATTSDALPPIIDAIKLLGDLQAIEIAATGSSAQSKGISANLGTQSHTLIARTLDSMSTRVEQCWRSASRSQYSVDRQGNQYGKLYGMWGLTSVEQNDLKSAMVTCEKIQPVAAELAAVTDSPQLIADAQEAKRLQLRAHEVLTFDYPNEGRYTKDPKTPTK